MVIGLIDVDGHGFPNLALMKIAAYHKRNGDLVEWYSIFNHYDIVYMSKVFSHKPDYGQVITNADLIEKGGTGYSLTKQLPPEIDMLQPDYSIYPEIDSKTAYGFLTRGCPNKCSWCVVPKKEGAIRPYMDVDDIAIDGRNKLILMDNNIVACDYGLAQIDKIISRRYRVDFNQALDARLINDDIAKMLVKVRWLDGYIRLGCDTPKQVEACEDLIERLFSFGYTGGFLLYTMLHGSLEECYHRVSYWRTKYASKVWCQAQPMLDFTKQKQDIPQWQKDLAHWCNRRWIYGSCDFKDYEPRKGFRCDKYFE